MLCTHPSSLLLSSLRLTYSRALPLAASSASSHPDPRRRCQRRLTLAADPLLLLLLLLLGKSLPRNPRRHRQQLQQQRHSALLLLQLRLQQQQRRRRRLLLQPLLREARDCDPRLWQSVSSCLSCRRGSGSRPWASTPTSCEDWTAATVEVDTVTPSLRGQDTCGGSRRTRKRDERRRTAANEEMEGRSSEREREQGSERS